MKDFTRSIVSDDGNVALAEFVDRWFSEEDLDAEKEVAIMRDLYDVVEVEVRLQRRKGIRQGRRQLLRELNEFLNRPEGGGT